MDNLVAEKLAAEKAAAEKAEAERLAKIEANRVALVAKAKAAGLTDAQATAYAAANKEATAAAAQKALDNLVAEKLAAEKAAAEKAEAERLAKIEANRVALVAKAKAAGLTEAQATDYAAANKEASVEAAQTALDGIVAENKRIADKKTDLTAKAQTAGLDATRAQTFANNNVNTADDAVANALTADVAKAVTADKVVISDELGLTTQNKPSSTSTSTKYITTQYGSFNTSQTETVTPFQKQYNQPYSTVLTGGEIITTYNSFEGSNTNNNRFYIEKISGLATLEKNIPNLGKSMYFGKAISKLNNTGDFVYTIDFMKRIGSGKITGWEYDYGDIILQEGMIGKITDPSFANTNALGITGQWIGSSNNNPSYGAGTGSYTLGMFGPNAQEIAGYAVIDGEKLGANGTVGVGYSSVVGFGGKQDENLQKAEERRLELISTAKAAGLTDAQATAYAAANKEADATAAQTALDKIVAENAKIALASEIAQAKGFSEGRYPIDQITATTQASSSSISNALTQESRIHSVVYNQNYSVVLGNYEGAITYNNSTGAIISDNRNSTINVKGLMTALDAIPQLGTATYSGKAFNGTYTSGSDIWSRDAVKEGSVTYNVDFGKRIGSGTINGLGNSVALNQSSISGNGISGTATQSFNNGTYSLNFFGKQAEEIGGKVTFNGKDTIGFGGTRGEITK